VIASGIANEGGAVLLYRSRDLRAWEFLHILSRRDRNGPAAFDPFNPWEVWECPEFFPLGDRHVLIFSTAGKTYWQSGRLDEEKMSFSVEQAGILDYGSYYAAKTQLDKEGNRIVWGWIQETRSPDEYKAAGWAGMMSLPRGLTLTAEGRLRFRVADAVESLRGHEQALTLNGDEQTIRRQINDLRIAGCCGEILLKARRTAGPFEVALYAGEEDAVPCLTLAFDSKHPGQISADARPLSLALDGNEELELHLYVDGSVIEVLVNGQVALTKRFYYSGRGPRDLRLQWKGSTGSIAGLSVWQLQPISADRLTS
jgi:beta-fructofuranosidase